MQRALVIADDITGALDTGVQLLGLGTVRVVHLPSGDGSRDNGSSPAVYVVDTASRHLTPAAAAARVVEGVRRYGPPPVAGVAPLIYKKTDSTLRGNIGSELASLLSLHPDLPLLFVPAYPGLGRTTEQGIQLVNGVPIAETAFGRDALNPVRTSRVADLIRTQTPVRVFEIYAAEDPAPIAEPGTISVIDAATDDDLFRVGRGVVRIYLRTGRFPLLAGCAGFAARLPEIISSGPQRSAAYASESKARQSTGSAKRSDSAQMPQSRPFPDPAPHRCGMFVVNGSRNPVSVAQIDAALRSGTLLAEVSPDPGDPTITAAAETAARALSGGRDIVLRLSPRTTPGSATGHDGGSRAGADAAAPVTPMTPMTRVTSVTAVTPLTARAEAAAAALAETVRRVARATPISVLVVFGGDTLAAILESLGIDTLVPVRELFHGVVCAQPEPYGSTGHPAPRYLVTKAGGFGEPGLVADIRALVRDVSREGTEL